MMNMKRFPLLTVAGAGLVSLLAPASISAQTTTTTTTTTPTIGQTIQLGVTHSAVAPPVCPRGVSATNCLIVLDAVDGARVAGRRRRLPNDRDAARPDRSLDGRPLEALEQRQCCAHSIHYLDTKYGGTTQAGISVLEPVGAKNLHQWQVVAESPIVHLQPYLGYVVQFPLATPLPVVAGDVVALTVKTWAPVLSIALTPSNSPTARAGRRAAPPGGVPAGTAHDRPERELLMQLSGDAGRVCGN